MKKFFKLILSKNRELLLNWLKGLFKRILQVNLIKFIKMNNRKFQSRKKSSWFSWKKKKKVKRVLLQITLILELVTQVYKILKNLQIPSWINLIALSEMVLKVLIVRTIWRSILSNLKVQLFKKFKKLKILQAFLKIFWKKPCQRLERWVKEIKVNFIKKSQINHNLVTLRIISKILNKI